MKPQHRCMNFWMFAIGLGLATLCSLPVAADDVVQRAKARLEANDAQAAYDLLTPLQSERAGDPEYDYLLGVAALDLGRNTEAVFALERVLAVQPNNAPARAQIARAYFALKETETARHEFLNINKQNLAPEVRQTIDRYLDAIDRVGETEKFKARFFLEFALGWDSNVNSATQVDQIAVPAFNAIFTLAPTAIEKHDAFFSAAGGIAITNPVSPNWSLLGGLSAYKRYNFVQDNFGTGYLDGYFGAAWKVGRDTISAVAQGNMFFVDDPVYTSEYRDAVGGTAQWSHDFNARNQLTAFVQYASLSYPQQTLRDANRYVVGVGYAHAFRRGDPIVYVGAYGGLEASKDETFDYLGHRPLGLRVGGQKVLAEQWLAFFSLAAEWRKYRGVDPFFLRERDDKQYSAGLGVTYVFANDWKLSPQITYLKNDSNIAIDQYDRTQVFVTLRKDF